MTVAEAIAQLEAQGTQVLLRDGDRVKLRRFPGARQEDQVAFLRAHRDEVVAFLKQRRGSQPFSTTLPPDDPYSVRLRRVLLSTCRPDYPAGMIPWLDTAHHDLYVALTETLPNEIHRLWSAGAPLADFDDVLAKMLATQREAIALYRAANTRGR